MVQCGQLIPSLVLWCSAAVGAGPPGAAPWVPGGGAHYVFTADLHLRVWSCLPCVSIMGLAGEAAPSFRILRDLSLG